MLLFGYQWKTFSGIFRFSVMFGTCLRSGNQVYHTYSAGRSQFFKELYWPSVRLIYGVELSFLSFGSLEQSFFPWFVRFKIRTRCVRIFKLSSVVLFSFCIRENPSLWLKMETRKSKKICVALKWKIRKDRVLKTELVKENTSPRGTTSDTALRCVLNSNKYNAKTRTFDGFSRLQKEKW